MVKCLNVYESYYYSYYKVVPPPLALAYRLKIFNNLTHELLARIYLLPIICYYYTLYFACTMQLYHCKKKNDVNFIKIK